MHKYSIALRSHFFLLFFLVTSCLAQDDAVYFKTEELTNLLASDSSKSWNLLERIVNGEQVTRECDTDDLLILTRSTNSQDTAVFHIVSGPIWCPNQSDSIIADGFWYTPDAINSQEICYITDGDTSSLTINFITSQFLQTSYMDGNNQVMEEYIYLAD